MKAAAAYLACGVMLASGVAAKEIAPVLLPSGIEAHLQEMLWDRPGSGLVYRFRFVAPAFSTDDADFDIVQSDLAHLCNQYALPKLSNVGPMPGQVIISLADRESEFGIYDPDVAQIFEAYRIEDGVCIWEAF